MNENLSAMEKENLSSAYINYAKNATLTMKQLNFRSLRTLAWMISAPFDIWALVETWFFKAGITKFLLIILLGAAVGFAVSGLFMAYMYIRLREFAKLERSEGYSPEFYKEMERGIAEKKIIPIIAADAYLMNGYADKALEMLDGVDSSTFVKHPSNAHIYYYTLITALLLKGDTEQAEKAYNSGFYYLKTYMNSPAYGDKVSLTLGIYEYYRQNYETALRLFDNAMRIVMASRKAKSRIPEENFICIVSYWKAMCFAAMGNKAAAWDIINSCRDLYASDYYKKCAAKLLDDMAEDEKRKNQTIS